MDSTTTPLKNVTRSTPPPPQKERPESSKEYELVIDDFNPMEIKGIWYDDEDGNKEWKTFIYKKDPTNDGWLGEFTLISKDSMRKEIEKNTVSPGLGQGDADVMLRSLNFDSDVKFYEHGVKITITQDEEGRTNVRGFGTNRFGSFTINGTNKSIHKRYHDVYRPKKKKKLLQITGFAAQKQAMDLANCIRSSLQDKRYDLEREVMEGKMNYPDVLKSLGDDTVSISKLKDKMTKATFSARNRAVKSFVLRYIEREKLMTLANKIGKELDEMMDTLPSSSSPVENNHSQL